MFGSSTNAIPQTINYWQDLPHQKFLQRFVPGSIVNLHANRLILGFLANLFDTLNATTIVGRATSSSSARTKAINVSSLAR